MDGLDILIWKLTVNDEMIGLNKRFHWSERDTMNLIWITVLFVVIMTFMYFCMRINKATEK